jgi:hypothetical protein
MTRKVLAALACLLGVPPLAAQEASFRRADANVDAKVDISDGVRILEILFLGAANPGCDDALDSNDSGKVDISDGVYVLNFLFAGGPRPPDPYPDCGADATADDIACAAFASCTPCLDQEFVDVTIATDVPDVTCLLADSGTYVVDTIEATACPSAEAAGCPGVGDAPGCRIGIEPPVGVLDAAGRTISVSVTGLADDFPVRIRDTVLGSSIVCLLDMEFTGTGSIPFTVDGTNTIVAVSGPVFGDVNAALTEVQGGLICEALADFWPQFEPQVVDAIKASSVEFFAGVRSRLIGLKLCP